MQYDLKQRISQYKCY